jgi:hypothetical protein
MELQGSDKIKLRRIHWRRIDWPKLHLDASGLSIGNVSEVLFSPRFIAFTVYQKHAVDDPLGALTIFFEGKQRALAHEHFSM